MAGDALGETLRLDKWLWFARFVKSRSLATRLVVDGRMRVNGAPTQKAHYAVKVGDVPPSWSVPGLTIYRLRRTP